MRIRLLLFFIFSMTFAVAKAQSKLEIEIVNLRNSKGYVALELVDKNKKPINGAKVKIENNTCIIIFENLKNDFYAVQFFHDENSNDKIEKNFIGIPKEGFGFSNNAMGMFGPKDFKEWLFEIKGDKKIQLEINYW